MPAAALSCRAVVEAVEAEFTQQQDSVWAGCTRRALDRLSGELYSDETHWILELIQNADDNTYAAGCVPSITFRRERETVVVVNNEVGFREKNVRAICSIADSTKERKAGQIGRKGIGFKACFSVSDRPEIHSGGFHFELHTESKIVPRWIEPHNRMAGIDSADQTYIVLPLRQGLSARTTTRLFERFETLSCRLLLFLNRLRTIVVTHEPSRISDDGGSTGAKPRVMVRTDHGDGGGGGGSGGSRSMVELDDGDGGREQWLVFRKRLTKMPKEKPEDPEATEIAMAVLIDDGDSVSSKHEAGGPQHQHQVFAFLPVACYGFKFIVHADFHLTSSREAVNLKSSFNEKVRDNLHLLFVDAVRAVKAQDDGGATPFAAVGEGISSSGGEAASTANTARFRMSLCQLLQKIPLASELQLANGFFASVAAKIATALQSEACIPVEGGGWCRPSEAVYTSRERLGLIPAALLHQALGLRYARLDLVDTVEPKILSALRVQPLQATHVLSLLEKMSPADQRALGTAWPFEVLLLLDELRCLKPPEHCSRVALALALPLTTGEWSTVEALAPHPVFQYPQKGIGADVQEFASKLAFVKPPDDSVDAVKVRRALRLLGVVIPSPQDIVMKLIVPAFKEQQQHQHQQHQQQHRNQHQQRGQRAASTVAIGMEQQLMVAYLNFIRIHFDDIAAKQGVRYALRDVMVVPVQRCTPVLERSGEKRYRWKGAGSQPLHRSAPDQATAVGLEQVHLRSLKDDWFDVAPKVAVLTKWPLVDYEALAKAPSSPSAHVWSVFFSEFGCTDRFEIVRTARVAVDRAVEPWCRVEWADAPQGQYWGADTVSPEIASVLGHFLASGRSTTSSTASGGTLATGAPATDHDTLTADHDALATGAPATDAACASSGTPARSTSSFGYAGAVYYNEAQRAGGATNRPEALRRIGKLICDSLVAKMDAVAGGNGRQPLTSWLQSECSERSTAPTAATRPAGDFVPTSVSRASGARERTRAAAAAAKASARLLTVPSSLACCLADHRWLQFKVHSKVAQKYPTCPTVVGRDHPLANRSFAPRFSFLCRDETVALLGPHVCYVPDEAEQAMGADFWKALGVRDTVSAATMLDLLRSWSQFSEDQAIVDRRRNRDHGHSRSTVFTSSIEIMAGIFKFLHAQASFFDREVGGCSSAEGDLIRAAFATEKIVWVPQRIGRAHAASQGRDPGGGGGGGNGGTPMATHPDFTALVPGNFYSADELAWNDPSFLLDHLEGPPRVLAPHYAQYDRRVMAIFQKRLCGSCLQGGFGARGTPDCASCHVQNSGSARPLGGSTCLVPVHATVTQHVEKLERFAARIGAEEGRDRALKILRVMSANIFFRSVPAEVMAVLGPGGRLHDKKIFPARTAGGEWLWVSAKDRPAVMDDPTIHRLFPTASPLSLLDFGYVSPVTRFDRPLLSEIVDTQDLAFYGKQLGSIDVFLARALGKEVVESLDFGAMGFKRAAAPIGDSGGSSNSSIGMHAEAKLAVAAREVYSLRPLLQLLGIGRLSAMLHTTIKVERPIRQPHAAFGVVARAIPLAQRWLAAKFPALYGSLATAIAGRLAAMQFYVCEKVDELVCLELAADQQLTHPVSPAILLENKPGAGGGLTLYVQEGGSWTDNAALHQLAKLFFPPSEDRLEPFHLLSQFLDNAELRRASGEQRLAAWLEEETVPPLAAGEAVWVVVVPVGEPHAAATLQTAAAVDDEQTFGSVPKRRAKKSKDEHMHTTRPKCFPASANPTGNAEPGSASHAPRGEAAAGVPAAEGSVRVADECVILPLHPTVRVYSPLALSQAAEVDPPVATPSSSGGDDGNVGGGGGSAVVEVEVAEEAVAVVEVAAAAEGLWRG
jgi:hypothetical protein